MSERESGFRDMIRGELGAISNSRISTLYTMSEESYYTQVYDDTVTETGMVE